MACCAALYALGRPPTPRPDRLWRSLAFSAGLACVAVAASPSVHELADKLFWVHMVQHVLLLLIAPPLLALARPWHRMLHGVPLGVRRRFALGAVHAPGRAAAARWVGRPAVAWGLFNVTLLAWHLPAAYDATLASPVVHAAEHLTFFATGLLFWTRVIDSPPWRSTLDGPGRLVYLLGGMVVSWGLAVALAFAPSPLYAVYADQASRPGGITAFADQQIAAGVMWVPGSIPFALAIVIVATGLLDRGMPAEPDSRAAREPT